MHMFDPRLSMKAFKIATEMNGAQSSRLQWIGNSGKILVSGTCGYNNTRHYSIFDIR